jgi:hypothetical protein
MRKKVSYFLLVSFVLSVMVLNPVYAATIYSENFGTGIEWTTELPAGWSASDDTTSGMDDQLSVSGGSDGNRYA